jgi:DNA-directed RNA polymerase specialized sigma24 family protein
MVSQEGVNPRNMHWRQCFQEIPMGINHRNAFEQVLSTFDKYYKKFYMRSWSDATAKEEAYRETFVSVYPYRRR